MLVEVQRTGEPVLVDRAPDEFVLDLVRESEVSVREAERRRLRLARHWAERHVVTEVLDAAHWSDADLRDAEETIGGAGTPLIASACVEPLAAALGVSRGAAMRLLSESLDLAYRLPRTNKGVETLRIAPWRARRIAALTHDLSPQAAAYVDEQLAPVADSCGVVKIQRLVAEAIARFDPETQKVVEDEAKAAWGMRLEDYTGPVWGGTSRLEFIGDTPTLAQFADFVNTRAHQQLDPALPAIDQPIEHRKIAALAQIAAGGGATSTTTAYLHFNLTDVSDLPDPLTRVGGVERLGPLTLARIREWLDDNGPGNGKGVVIRPVLDLARSDAVDQHDPPAWMRELVILRDRTCVHPYCDKPARECDLDHIEAFVEMDDGGPPGPDPA